MPSDEAAYYRVWGADDVAYGPVELPTLVGWLKAGRVIADTWVFRTDSQTWSKASTLPELRMFFESGSGSPPTSVSPLLQDFGVKPGSLRRIKVFAEMDEKQLESLLQYLEVMPFKQFSQVVRVGEEGDAMFLVLEGELRARTLIGGKETTFTTMTTGDFFGEISLLDHGPRSADVVANQDSVLLKISATAFEKIVREAPALATLFLYALSKSIVGRIRTLTKKYEDSIHFSRIAGGVR